MKYIKENWQYFLFFVLVCIVGGYFSTIYLVDTLDSNMIEEAVKQIGSKELLMVVSVVQITIYAVIFTGIGIILSNKIGLWKKFEMNKQGLITVLVLSVVGGLSLSVVDKYVFGSFIDPVWHSYDSKPTVEYVISSFTYGGVFEEILIRLFLMSLLAWVISKLFYAKEEDVPVKVLVIANVISALLFAAGHLPSTKQIFGYMDGLILFRCFLINGLLGLAFGYLYRKYGIGYSMLAHIGTHFVSKLIWMIFI